MPEFGAQLHEQCIWEWKPYYLNYERLKGWINELESNRSEQSLKVFFDELDSSLKRVDRFYTTQETLLQDEVKAILDAPTPQVEDPETAEENSRLRRLLDGIDKLRMFAEQNREGFRKIAKKFDKNLAKVHIAYQMAGQSLQEKVVEVVRTYPFADAEKRLGRIQDAIQRWEQGRTPGPVSLRHLTPDVDRLRRLRLREPLLVPRRKAMLNARRIVGKAAQLLRCSLPFLAPGAAVGALARAAPSERLQGPSYVVIWVTGTVLTLLVQQKSPDIVLMGATLFLTICGILDEGAAWAAFSNNVVLSVAGLGVVAHAVEQTGVIDIIFGALLGKPKSLQVAMLRLFVPAVFLNVCISNTCVMSCLVNMIDRWSKDIGFDKAFFLMPLSYILLISGTFAIFSTSTNLIAQGLLLSHGEPGFENFALALPATVSTLVALVYLLFVAPSCLQRFQVKGEHEERERSLASMSLRLPNRYDVRVQVTGSTVDGKTLEASGLLNQVTGGMQDICTCERYGVSRPTTSPDFVLARDDIIWIRTGLDGIANLFHMPGIIFLAFDLKDNWATSDQSSRDLVEAVLDQACPMVGHRLGDARKYRPEYDCPIVAYRRYSHFQGVQSLSADNPAANIAEGAATPDTVLRPGDHIVMNAPSTFYHMFKDSSDFVVLRRVHSGESAAGEGTDSSKAALGGSILLGLIVLVSTSTLPLLEAVFLALSALMVTDCTSMDAVVRAVRLRTTLTIVGAFGLGKAIGQEGVAGFLAEMLIFVLEPFGRRGLLVAIFAATVALGVIFHGTAVVVLMFPICQEVAQSMEMPIHQLVAVLCLAVSCQMLSPISYQTNLMAYSTGAYQFADFTKVGAGLILSIALVAIPLCEHAFPS